MIQKFDEYKCENCHQNKLIWPGYGLLPPRETPLVPWSEVMVGLIDPWKIETNGEDIYFNALTCIDPVTNLVEIICIENKTSNHVARKFDLTGTHVRINTSMTMAESLWAGNSKIYLPRVESKINQQHHEIPKLMWCVKGSIRR